jgi:N-acetylmuramoyl-L-alanine amidase
MAPETRHHRTKKRILQLVYEDNQRIEHPDRRPPHRSSVTMWAGVGVMAVMVATLIFFVSLLNRRTQVVLAEPADDVQEVAARIPSLDTPAVQGDIPDAAAYGQIGTGAIPVARLFDLDIRTIVIDPGHGGRDPGAVGSTGLEEKEITLDVALRLAERLRALTGYRVELTRETDSTSSLRSRAEFANENDADLFVSIHVNYFPTEPVFALETYYFGPQSDASSLKLAELENRDSDYSVAEFDRMMGHFGDRVKLQESKRLAGYVQQSLFRNTKKINRRVSDWGVKTAPFVVLVGASAPGILSEIGVISNREEESRLRAAPYREELALFLEEGIVNYLNERARTDTPPQSEENDATEKEAGK